MMHKLRTCRLKRTIESRKQLVIKLLTHMSTTTWHVRGRSTRYLVKSAMVIWVGSCRFGNPTTYDMITTAIMLARCADAKTMQN